jgi:hypothetical protein
MSFGESPANQLLRPDFRLPHDVPWTMGQPLVWMFVISASGAPSWPQLMVVAEAEVAELTRTVVVTKKSASERVMDDIMDTQGADRAGDPNTTSPTQSCCAPLSTRIVWRDHVSTRVPLLQITRHRDGRYCRCASRPAREYSTINTHRGARLHTLQNRWSE